MQRHPEHADAIRRGVRRRTNAARENAGRDPLARDKRLAEIAANYVETMGQHGELEHDVDGTTPQDRASSFANVGENLHRQEAPGFDPSKTARQTVRAWVDSPDHRTNMLRREASVDGLGVYISGDMVYVCHLIASKQTLGRKIEARVSSWFS